MACHFDIDAVIGLNGRFPFHLDYACGLLAFTHGRQIGTIRTMDRYAASAGNVTDNIIAGYGIAASRETHKQVIDPLNAYAVRRTASFLRRLDFLHLGSQFKLIRFLLLLTELLGHFGTDLGGSDPAKANRG